MVCSTTTLNLKTQFNHTLFQHLLGIYSIKTMFLDFIRSYQSRLFINKNEYYYLLNQAKVPD